MSSAPTTHLVPAPTPWWRPLTRADRWALFWFVVIPAVVFIGPALFGHPAIDADNLIQNFPLRVLAGQQIASGHLPLLDPLANAGTPLLGGMNAGALYPLTFLFVFVPAVAAWVVNLMAVYVTSAVGVFALARWHGLRTMPAFVAAITYTYAGAMVGQMVHLGVVQGFSLIPWAVVLMLALSRRLRGVSAETPWPQLLRVMLPWTCAVALLWGLTFLTGEPRAIAVMELLTIIVVPSVLLLRTSYWLSSWRTRVAYGLTLLVGFAWSVGIGLIQLLPGWAFINFSQRSEVNYGFFGAGSLALRWTALLFSPDIFGGNGAIDQRGFFVNYNLAEVTGYAGILTLMALVAFLTRLTWKGWRYPERDYTIYVVVCVVGLFSTWGSFTPLGHLFRAIPLFGSTRLQSRNVILVDFALSIFLGWWFQHVQDRKIQAGLERGFRWAVALPAIAVAAFSLALVVWGPAVITRIGIPAGSGHNEVFLELINSLRFVIALAAALAVLCWRRSSHLIRILLCVLAADLLVFALFTASGVVGGTGPREASKSAAVSLFGTKGRFALVDAGGVHTGQYRAIGEPNMNVFTGLDSVQGYGALISTIYDDVTGTHPQATLNACHLAAGTFDQLRLSALAVSANVVSTSVASTAPVPKSCVKTKRAPSTSRYFGEVLDVSSIALSGVDGAPMSSGSIAVHFLGPNGAIVHDASNRFAGRTGGSKGLRAVRLVFSRPILAAGVVISSNAGVNVGNAVVTTTSGSHYQLDTDFQLALSTTSWHLSATQGSFSVFKARSIKPPAWLLGPSSNGRVTKIRTASWGDTWVSVALSTSTELIRSEAYLPGWRATALNTTNGRVVDLSVHRDGLIEKVDVPAGKWTIHFHYHAPYIEVSTAISAASLLLFLGVVCGLGLKRRRRNARVHS